MIQLAVKKLTKKGGIVEVLPLPETCFDIPLEKGLILKDAITENEADFLQTERDELHDLACLKIVLSYFPDLEKIAPKTSVTSYQNLAYHLIEVLNGHKIPNPPPDRYVFEHAGHRWFLDGFIPEVLTGRLSNERLTTWQAVRAMEADRLFELSGQDATALNRHTTVINQIAAVLEMDQPWPKTIAGMEVELRKRMLMLENMPFGHVINILSFFLIGREGSNLTDDFTTFGIHRPGTADRSRWSKMKDGLKGLVTGLSRSRQ